MNEPVDNCGVCITTPVRPWQVIALASDAVRAWYYCPRCGHCWWTSYLLGVEETGRVLRQAGAA